MKAFTLTTCLLLLLCLSHQGHGNIGYSYAVRAPKAANFIFNLNLVFSSKVKSLINCLRACVSIEKCAGFTFTQGQDDGVCRGHTTETSNNKTASPSTEAYRLPSRFVKKTSIEKSSTVIKSQEAYPSIEKKSSTASGYTPPAALYGACTTDVNCRGANRWMCHSAQCLCALGFYYSAGTKDCVQDCKTEELLKDFVKYPELKLAEPNVLQELFSETVSTTPCRDLCLNKQGCRAVNLDTSSNNCTGLGEAMVGTSLNSSHFQKQDKAVFSMIYCK